MSVCSNGTKKQFSCLILFLSLWMLSIRSTNAQCTDAGCVDCFDWCRTSKQYCHVGAIRTNCRKTCKTCPTEASACLQLNCGQKCILSDDGSTARCACDDGYLLDADGRTCNDIDECAISSTICQNNSYEGFCRNLEGTYACLTCQATGARRLWNYLDKDECCIRNQPEECGKATTNGGKIVGGRDSKIDRWPWTAYLRIDRELCTGTLITRRHVLTAAHCVWRVSSDNLRLITVLLGVTRVADATDVHVQTRNVTRMHIHPNYNFPFNDIAILELNQPVIVDSIYANTICLSDGEEPQENETCYASGYGVTSYRGNPTDEIQEVALPIVSGATCERAYQNQANRVNSTLHICAGYAEGGRDTCQGDSGGPLVCQRCRNCDWYLAGITAFGRECARPGFYGVFTRTRSYEKWITGITQQPYVSASKPRCVKASWHPWAPWTSCSVTCGVGERTRIRICVNGREGDPGCIGSRSEIAKCNAAACSGLTQWSSCSATCGSGYQRRERLGDVETKQCNERRCPTWSEFRSWSECTQTCGGGVRRAFRECLNDVVGGGGCPGSNEETQVCNTQCCPHWSEFGEFSECPVTCGGGFRIASRTCQCANADGSGCEGDDMSFEVCGFDDCPGFSQWSAYGPCSANCNGGQRVRTRRCMSNSQCAADEHGLATEQQEPCNTTPCSVGWTSWEDFGSCSVTCGNGFLSQSRRCFGGIPGDFVCPGGATRTTQCNLGSCPAQWGPYTQFSSCSVTCGEGTQYRTRECIGGVIGTGDCIGEAREERTCNLSPCFAGGSTGGRDCSHIADVTDSTTCCNYAKLGYCSPLSQFHVYMSRNCASTCCEYSRGEEDCQNKALGLVLEISTLLLCLLFCIPTL